MSGIRYVVAGMCDQPEHPDLPGQVVAHVCLNARIGLSFVPDPAPGFRKTRPTPTCRHLTGPQFPSLMRQGNLVST